MSKIDLEEIGRLIILYKGLDKCGRRLRIAAMLGSTGAYIRRWLQKANVLINDRQLCELELGVLIGSSVPRSSYPWDMFDKLIKVMEWQLHCQEGEEVHEEEDSDFASVGASAVWDSEASESSNDEEDQSLWGGSSASGHPNDPIVIDE
ncbi:hypothetical protein JAAARDRAFT_197927 [Jaapia argillacea MUCL 33604]|uniref:Uncharacterized protein n=1 Tax=Jaapia argillacea MUCL 33604 TaxID=933084 RepID=A0A067PRB6_9AGAM|nr:hypothetical protein JAAARDRAFT_197927 [Jaapia argillacea MUCL 33604]